MMEDITVRIFILAWLLAFVVISIFGITTIVKAVRAYRHDAKKFTRTLAHECIAACVGLAVVGFFIFALSAPI